jgi:hypothetical protein
MDLARALTKLRPGAKWSISGNTLTWLDATPEPTTPELEAAWLEVVAENEADATEETQVKAVLQDLKNGVGTTAQRLTRAERAIIYLFRN